MPLTATFCVDSHTCAMLRSCPTSFVANSFLIANLGLVRPCCAFLPKISDGNAPSKLSPMCHITLLIITQPIGNRPNGADA